MSYAKTLCSLILATTVISCGEGSAPSGKNLGPSAHQQVSPVFHRLHFVTKDGVPYNFDVLAYRKGVMVVNANQQFLAAVVFVVIGACCYYFGP